MLHKKEQILRLLCCLYPFSQNLNQKVDCVIQQQIILFSNRKYKKARVNIVGVKLTLYIWVTPEMLQQLINIREK